MAENLKRQAWVDSLIEQHPNHEQTIRNAADEAQGFYGTDFGDHILGALEEKGVEV